MALRTSIAIGLLGCALAAQAPPVRICPLGDSIMQSFGGQFSPRYYLDRLLTAHGCAFDFVGHNSSVFLGEPADPAFDQDHEAYAGWQVNHVLVDLEMWVRETQPDVVVVHLGTNDLIRRQGAASTVDELAQCIDVIRGVNRHATVVITQIIPMVGRDVASMNALIPAMVAAKDRVESRVVVADAYSRFDPDVHLLSDGIHPNDAGEQLLAAVWFEVLRELVAPAAQAATRFGTGCGDSDPAVRPIRGQAASLGNPFSVEIGGAPELALPLAILGFDAASYDGIPLPFDLGVLAAPGCELLVAPGLTFPLVNSGGATLWTLTVPDDPMLAGGVFYEQVAFLNPALNALGLVFSDAVAVTVVGGWQ